jgi:hypothetical protein
LGKNKTQQRTRPRPTSKANNKVKLQAGITAGVQGKGELSGFYLDVVPLR